MDNSFIKGMISGYIGAICVYPIDVIKTRMQNNVNQYYKNGFDCLIKIIKTEGYRTFYKGSFIQLIGIGPEKAIKLYVNEVVSSCFIENNLIQNKIIAGACAGASQVMITNPIEVIKIQYQMNTNKHLSLYNTIKYIGGIKQLYKGASVCFLRDIPFSAIYFSVYDYLKNNLLIDNKPNYLLSGLLSAIPAAYLVTPMDVIKTRIQTKNNNNYKNVIDCVKKIYNNEGFRAFWRGGVWRVLKSSPQFGITLYIYEYLN
jgi:solute carrier family 25 aspartate/glutamate transporter 12/13